MLAQSGRPTPSALEAEARLARAAWMSSLPLLARIRSLSPAPLLLIKGPEVAALYPDRARAFVDIDLLTPEAEEVHAALRAHGFIEVDDPDLFVDHHHLRPLRWPALWLKVEIHQRPMWPEDIACPPVAEIASRAVPSATRVPGLSAPDPAAHALILASHAWVHEPLHTLRDLLDVALVAHRAEPAEITALAQRWGVERIWRTTHAAAEGLFGERPPSRATVVWARQLLTVSERTVLGNHLARSLQAFWALPFRTALRDTVRVLRLDLLPQPGETWREKLIRVVSAFRRPQAPLSSHTAAWQATAWGEDLQTHSDDPKHEQRR